MEYDFRTEFLHCESDAKWTRGTWQPRIRYSITYSVICNARDKIRRTNYIYFHMTIWCHLMDFTLFMLNTWIWIMLVLVCFHHSAYALYVKGNKFSCVCVCVVHEREHACVRNEKSWWGRQRQWQTQCGKPKTVICQTPFEWTQSSDTLELQNDRKEAPTMQMTQRRRLCLCVWCVAIICKIHL